MRTSEKIHLVGIEEPALRDLAVGLKLAGHSVTGSAGSIDMQEAAKLLRHKLIPEKNGWFPDKIHDNLGAVVVGAGVKADNPEIVRARQLNVPVHTFPGFIYKKSEDKQRLVVAGSYGKGMIAAIIIHVLNFHKRKFDYVVSAPSASHGDLVRLSDAPLIVIESQEVRSTSADRTPEFLEYRHHIGLVSGIEWQKSDNYPTKEEYTRQFSLFSAATPKSGALIYFELDHVVAILSPLNRPDVMLVPYKTHASIQENGQEFLITSSKERVPLKITGKHNFQSISAAQEAVKKVGITSEMFYQAIPSFAGIGN